MAAGIKMQTPVVEISVDLPRRCTEALKFVNHNR